MNDDILLPHETAKNRTITIEDRYWNIAKQIGQGNASRGIRAALYKMSLEKGNDTARAVDTEYATRAGNV